MTRHPVLPPFRHAPVAHLADMTTVPLTVRERAIFAAVEARILHHRAGRAFVTSPTKTLPRTLPIALPRTANAKFVWRKLFDHDPRWVTLTDKIDAKHWIAAHHPDVPMPRTLWGGATVRDMPLETLDRPAMMKPAHGQGRTMVLIPGQFDPAHARRRARNFLAQRHGHDNAEWAYDHLRPRVILEEQVGGGTETVEDLKLFFFGGHLEYVLRIRNRTGPDGAQAYTLQNDVLTFAPDEDTLVAETVSFAPPAPYWTELLETAHRIAADFDHIRVDFLCTEAGYWLGELTIYNLGGHRGYDGPYPHTPCSTLWDLRKSWFLRTEHRGWRGLYARTLLQVCDRAAAMGRQAKEQGAASHPGASPLALPDDRKARDDDG